MKILNIVTTRFEISGITNSVMNYFRYIDKSDMSIDFLVPNKVPSRLKDEIESNGGRVFEVERNRRPLSYFNNLVSIISKEKYDIVHAHGNSSTLVIEMLAAKKAGVNIRIAHSRNTTCKYLKIDKILRPLFHRYYTHGFACGEAAGKWLFGNRKFTVITNGNVIEKFAFRENVRKEYRKKYNIENQKVIGHVGSFNYQKNHEFLIDIFKRIINLDSNYTLMLVGDGPLMPSIQDKVRSLNIEDKVIFIGKSFEVDKIVQAMDIMVLPSRYEGLPNVVVEWQIAGLQSVISDCVTKEVMLTENVEFLPLETGADLWANEIIKTKLVDRKLEREKIISEITKAGFNVKENAKDLKKIYLNLVNNC